MMPTAELIIVRTISGATSSRLSHGRAGMVDTSYSTNGGRDGAGEQLR